MPEPPASCAPVVYQLRVVLRHISPLIWRRLLVRSDSTVADLHAILQTAFGWSDEHLHRFVIQGRQYRDDGCIDPRRVRVAALGLRVRERFRYEYDFTDLWQHDLRVEKILRLEPGQPNPRCVGGRRAAPPEDCGGPWAFLELR
ncbi:MAG: plasmid pRiA4b ORF-3 family protein [Chloroflexi bacterium]|nr:plasmid pRiA4b ORF-3 family protein [Chloroflexota bacterium]